MSGLILWLRTKYFLASSPVWYKPFRFHWADEADSVHIRNLPLEVLALFCFLGLET